MKKGVAAWLLALAMPAHAADLPFGAAGPVSLRVTSMKEARFVKTVRQQFDFSCGSAALATLLTHHYGYVVNEQQAFAEMFARGDQARIRREGFSLLDMKNFLAAHGFTADGFQQPLDELVKAGFPAIVLVAEHGYHHFVVVKGVRDGRVLVGDPSGGTRALPRARFEAIWLNQLLFVIHDRGPQAALQRCGRLGGGAAAAAGRGAGPRQPAAGHAAEIRCRRLLSRRRGMR